MWVVGTKYQLWLTYNKNICVLSEFHLVNSVTTALNLLPKLRLHLNGLFSLIYLCNFNIM